MSLLSMNMQPCTRLEPRTKPDGEGGAKTTWEEGGVFDAALVLASSTQTATANQDTTADSYTVTTSRANALHFGDVFRCGEDTCKVVSDVKRTPNGALLDMAQVTAERWDLPK